MRQGIKPFPDLYFTNKLAIVVRGKKLIQIKGKSRCFLAVNLRTLC
jgi:hypothetical protein